MKFATVLAEKMILRTADENVVLPTVEDPKAEEEVQHKPIFSMGERCEKINANWYLPLVSYDFWTFDRFNAQHNWDAQIIHAPRRRDPYDVPLHHQCLAGSSPRD